MCATPWVDTALGDYRYVRIIKITNLFATYSCLSRSYDGLFLYDPPCMLALVEFMTCPVCLSVHLKLGWSELYPHDHQQLVPRRAPPIPIFLIVRPPNLHLPRRRSRQSLSCNFATIFLFFKESLDVREATVVARFEYVSRSLTVAASKSAIVLTVSSIFRLRALAEG